MPILYQQCIGTSIIRIKINVQRLKLTGFVQMLQANMYFVPWLQIY